MSRLRVRPAAAATLTLVGAADDPLVKDLEKLATVKTHRRFLSMPAEEMAALSAATGPPSDDAIDRLCAAIAAIRDDTTRRLASAIFPYETGWPTRGLTERRDLAANEIAFVSPRSFTDVRPDGSSHYRDVLMAIARELRAAAPEAESRAEIDAAQPDDAVPEVASPEETQPISMQLAARPPRQARWRWVPGGLAAAVLVVAVAVFVGARDGDAKDDTGGARSASFGTPAGAGTPCSVGIGEPASSLSPDADSRLRAHAADLDRVVPDDGCAASLGYAFVGSIVQDVRVGGRPAGVVMLSPDNAVVYLGEVLWQSYRQIIVGFPPEAAPEFAGYPLEVGRDAGAVVVELDSGGALYGVDADTQAFWLPAEVRDAWEAAGGVHGDLGLPTTNPIIDDKAYYQEYERGFGRVLAPVPARGPIELTVVDDAREQLAALGDLRGRIVEQRTSTSWYVDREGRRHWIPTGDVHECLGGTSNVAAREVPGFVVWLLPQGPTASCDDAA
jgi:hypothetical protein